MNRRDQAVVAVLVSHEQRVAAERADAPPLMRLGTVDPTDRCRFDGYVLGAIVRATGMPKREARRALARLVASGTVVLGGRFGDQYRLASGVS